jgi:hypothetical protein
MMQMSMEELWIVINSLSFIVYLPLFFVFPDNCQAVMEAFLSVVTFDIIATLAMFGIDIIPFTFIETPAYNDNFEKLGYDSSNTFSLMGSVNIIFFIMAYGFFAALIVKIIPPLQRTKCGVWAQNKFPWKGQLTTLNRLMVSGSLELLVCSIVTIIPSQTGELILLQMPWEELSATDKFALAYGIMWMALCCTMFLVYLFVIVYISPKVSLVEN